MGGGQIYYRSEYLDCARKYTSESLWKLYCPLETETWGFAWPGINKKQFYVLILANERGKHSVERQDGRTIQK